MALFYAGEDAHVPGLGSSHIIDVLAELMRTEFGTPPFPGAQTPASVLSTSFIFAVLRLAKSEQAVLYFRNFNYLNI